MQLQFNLTQEPKQIPIAEGVYTLVDAADYDWLMQWKWTMTNSGYSFRRKWVKFGPARHERKNTALYMHRQIMDAQEGEQVDHIDGNKLNNQRSNLRLCTRSQNHANMRKSGGTSIYKGVSWNTKANKWFVQTKFHGQPIWIGSFVDEVEAAKAYDEIARELFGDFAKTNFE